MSGAGANENPATMIRGVGVFRRFRLKPGSDVVKTVLPILIGDGQASSRKSDNAPPERATIVYTTQPPEVVLVEEWENSSRYSTYEKNNRDNNNNNNNNNNNGNNNHALQLKDFLLEPPTYEYFPESLHIYQDDTNESTIIAENGNNIGILVRQKTSSKENGCKLRDAQKEAYERQMQYEPNCTCCIILSGSSNDPSQVRIIELWKTIRFLFS